MDRRIKTTIASVLLLAISALITQAAAPATPQGSITAKYFQNIGGGVALADLTNNVRFPNSPDIVRYEPYFEAWAGGDINTPAPNDVLNNYGVQMAGYFYPAANGDFTFYISADDNAALFLSTDDNPANKRLIAIEPVWNNPREYQTPGSNATGRNLDAPENSSATYQGSLWPTTNTITLEAGKAYYIEALMKEGGGGDNLSVSIDGTLPIPGDRLSPFGAATAPTILSQPQEASVFAGGTATFSVGLDIPPGATLTSIQWQKNGVDIPNSNTNTISIAATAADNAAKIKAVITTSAGALTSSEATLNVATFSEEFTPGVVKFEAFTGIEGTSVDLLTGSEDYIANTPDDIRLLSAIDTPNGYGDNYGARVSGFIIPPETGSYRFFLRSDDASQLWLSTDTNVANAVLIADEVGCCDPFKEPDDTLAPSFETSLPQNLQAGQRYAFYALVKEGGGGDFLQVAARREGDTTPASALVPLSGTWIGANAKPSLGDPQITVQPQAIPQLLQGRNGTLNVGASVTPAGFNFPVLIQWQKDGQNIPGATATNLTITNASAASSGTYRAVVTAPSGRSTNTADAVVTYAADTFAPKVNTVAAVALDAVGVSFDEPLDKATAETLTNYTLSGGATISSAVLDPSGTVVRLTTGSLAPNQQYTLTVGGVKDVFNNTVPAGSQVQFLATFFSYADIILADGPIAFYRFEETSGSVAKNSGSTGGDGQYSVGNEPAPKEGGQPGTAKGEPGPRPPEFLGFVLDNHAASFDGVSEWVDTKNPFLQNLPAFTLEYWVRPVDRSTWPTRVGLVGQNDAIEYGFITQDTIQIWTPGGGALDTPYPFPSGEWHHVATIADGTNLKNYFDGVLVGTGGTPIADPETGYGGADFNVHIGGGGVFDGAGNWFKGQLDEVAIFNKAIPAERVAAHFRAGKQGGGETPPPGGFSSITLSGGQLTLTWTTGTLAASPTVTGPYTPVAGATSPYSVAPAGSAMFFQLRP